MALLVACATPATSPQPPVPIATDASVDVPIDAPAQLDPDGDDDPEDPGTGTAPASGTFVKVGAPPLALKRICDLTPFAGALYMAHANSPLGSDGATITKYAGGKFAVAFDWNRHGEPRRGGGAGQGFLRVHAIGGRLYVADADPPYNGLGVVERGTEGYVFISAADGAFERARMPKHRVPKSAGVLPRAYHVLDVVGFRGARFASAGSVPPDARAWRGPAPGALHRANADGTRWIYEVDYPFPYGEGVWRLTFMTRFRDRLYAGIQDYDGREPNDFLIVEPPRDATRLAREHVRAVRVTADGAAGTLRWWVDTRASRLYWIAWTRAGVTLHATTDGDRWTAIALPADAGRPSDIARFRDAVVILTERGLYRLDAGDVVTKIASVTDNRFAVDDLLCAAPLAVFENELYAGGQRGGALWKLTAP